MGLYQTFKTNAGQERQGRWFEIAGVKNDDGTEPGFKMARMAKSNPAYQAAIERVAKDLKQAIELDTLSEDVAGPVMRRVFCEVVLLDWRNVQNEKGEAIPFNVENALQLFDDLPDLYFVLTTEAAKLGNYRAAEVEAVSKKSSPPSRQLSGNTGT